MLYGHDLERVDGDVGRQAQDLGSLAGSVMFDYKAAANAIDKLEAPTEAALENEKYLARLDFIEATLKDAIDRINNDVGGAVGLEAGFSFADGD